ncbi:MAG: NUDIX domain-containing protein [Alphaproteobacteria bacterium]|nr:MAG: NUDIX domain-containing protein [Alphaproteobacteria bacterium]
MPRRSAGILPYRQVDGELQVLLVHPGGPFWRNRDNGAWSVSKGEYESDEEESEAAARREFTEETGWTADGPMIELDEIRQAGGKYLNIYAMEAAFDPATFVSNTFQLEWPPRSGRLRSFPEVDQVSWFSLSEARMKILPSQLALLDQIQQVVAKLDD